MAEYDETNRGAIWKNEEKKTDKHPDFTGSLNVKGVNYRVAAWKRPEGAAPRAPALKFQVEPKNEQPQTISQQAMPKRPDPISSGPAKRNFPGDDMDDLIPFAPEFR
jgi:hypothetical protein